MSDHFRMLSLSNVRVNDSLKEYESRVEFRLYDDDRLKIIGASTMADLDREQTDKLRELLKYR